MISPKQVGFKPPVIKRNQLGLTKVDRTQHQPNTAYRNSAENRHGGQCKTVKVPGGEKIKTVGVIKSRSVIISSRVWHTRSQKILHP